MMQAGPVSISAGQHPTPSCRLTASSKAVTLMLKTRAEIIRVFFAHLVVGE